MTGTRQQMHLAVFWLGTGNHSAGWRMDGAVDSNCDWNALEQAARIAEAGKFDMFFISDALGTGPTDHPSFMSRFEPTTAIAALSRVTEKIGLGATVSTSFSYPYTVARTFQALQHISRGRVAWNVVTSNAEVGAKNYGLDRQIEHDERYEIAEEFVDVVRGLWATYDRGAFVRDRVSGVFVDPAKVRTLDHAGRYFKVRGPINVERPVYGEPLLIQAGGSEPGQALSARTADIVFSIASGDRDEAKAAYGRLKGRLARYRRTPDQLAILPGVMPIVGRTDAEAKAQLDKLQNWLATTDMVTLVSHSIGHDISGYPLDEPVPDLPPSNNSQTFSRTLLALARRERMTLRDLYNLAAAGRGHWVLCGSAERIADTLEAWFTSGAADGFMILPAHFPGGLQDFVDLVVPLLQQRGLFRRDYEGATLRDHFGLAVT